MSCEANVISQSDIGCVTVCECGTVTVHCGNAAMRVSKKQFTTFARMLDEAFANLAERELSKGKDDGGNMGNLYPGMGPFCS